MVAPATPPKQDVTDWGDSDDEEYEDEEDEEEEEEEGVDRAAAAALPEFPMPAEVGHKPPRDLQVYTHRG